MSRKSKCQMLGELKFQESQNVKRVKMSRKSKCQEVKMSRKSKCQESQNVKKYKHNQTQTIKKGCAQYSAPEKSLLFVAASNGLLSLSLGSQEWDHIMGNLFWTTLKLDSYIHTSKFTLLFNNFIRTKNTHFHLVKCIYFLRKFTIFPKYIITSLKMFIK